MTQQKIKILVVEDEGIVGIDIKESLEALGYQVLKVIPSGQEAIQFAVANKPSLVLMDIMLKGSMDGIEAAKEITNKIKIPVVFLTAHADTATLERAKITEPYGYILKPFKQIELRTVIELALYRYESDRQRQANESISEDSLNIFNSLAPIPHSHKERPAIISFLQSIEAFKELNAKLFDKIADVSRMQSYAAGDFIAFEGDKKLSPFLVMQGRAALLKSSASGKDLIVELLPAGDPFGLLIGLEKHPCQFGIKAQLATTLLWLPEPIITYLLNTFAELRKKTIDVVLARLRKAHDLSRALAHDRVEVRVASALLALIPRNSIANGPSEIVLSRQELAEMTGTAPETASRVANSLERDGILDLSLPGKVRILKREDLSDMIEDELG